MLRSTGWACGLLAAATGLAAGQVVRQETTEIRTPGGRTTEVRRISTVIGSSVQVQQGVRYGEIADFVLNENGCVEYVVVRHEDRFVLVPWTVARVDYGQRVVTIDTTPQVLQQVTFTEADWPTVVTPEYTRRVEQAFGSAVRRDAPGGVDLRSVEPGDRPLRPGDRPLRPGDRPGGEVRPQAEAPDRPPGGVDRPGAERPPGLDRPTPPPTEPRPQPGPDRPGSAPPEPRLRPGAGQPDPTPPEPRPRPAPAEPPPAPETPRPGPPNPMPMPGQPRP